MIDGSESTIESAVEPENPSITKKEALAAMILSVLIKNKVWFILFIATAISCVADRRMLSPTVMINVLEHSSILGILVIGLTFCLITGHFDLSSESTLGYTALLGGWLVSTNPWASGWLLPPYIAILIMLLIGIGVGFANSFFILKLKINAFIVTLSTLLALRGITKIWTHAKSLYDLPHGFIALGSSQFGTIPTSVIFFLVLFAVGQAILSYTSFGRDLYAIGGNSDAAYVAGIPVKRRIRAALLISGLLGAVAGWVIAGRLESVTMRLGQGMIFEVFAAAVIGGVSLKGGKGNLIGPLGGVLLLGVITTALSILPISAYWVDAVQGIVILVAVVLDRLTLTYEEKWLGKLVFTTGKATFPLKSLLRKKE